MAIKYIDYLITPADIYRGVLHLKNNMRRRDFLGIIILALVFSYTNHLSWQIDSSIFFCFFVALFFWNLDSRISIALALIFLTSCPFLLIAYNDYNFLWGEDWAETAAAWAYYFLVFGVLKQLWDMKKEDVQPPVQNIPLFSIRKLKDVEDWSKKPEPLEPLNKISLDELIKERESEEKLRVKDRNLIFDIEPIKKK